MFRILEILVFSLNFEVNSMIIGGFKMINWKDYILGLKDVEVVNEWGYIFYFYKDDHKIPFVSIAETDNPQDDVSQLHRDGVYRLNIGVSKATFNSINKKFIEKTIDYSQLDEMMPHPHYAKMQFVCILNPKNENIEFTKRCINESYENAKLKYERKHI